MPGKTAKKSKRDVLKRHGTLNPHPNVVTDPLFETGDFFDRDDVVQVKYEMLPASLSTNNQSRSPQRHSASHALPTIKRKRTFSEMDSSGYCPRSEGHGEATNSRRRFWTSLYNSGQAILRCALWTWLLPSRNGSL